MIERTKGNCFNRWKAIGLGAVETMAFSSVDFTDHTGGGTELTCLSLRLLVCHLGRLKY